MISLNHQFRFRSGSLIAYCRRHAIVRISYASSIFYQSAHYYRQHGIFSTDNLISSSNHFCSTYIDRTTLPTDGDLTIPGARGIEGPPRKPPSAVEVEGGDGKESGQAIFGVLVRSS